MTGRPLPRLHHKQDDVIRLFNAGCTNTEIASRLHMDRSTVGRLRRDLGYPPAPRPRPRPRSLGEVFTAGTTSLPGGHVLWTGHRTEDGTPVLKHQGRHHTVRRVAWFLEHGWWPKGRVTAGCEHRWCVTGHHQRDSAGVQQARADGRAVTGMPRRPAVCGRGHDQLVHGRLGPDWRAYCQACKTASAAGGRVVA
ncbi:hypothetical protein RM572_00785 [Streptomyces sp. DSM 42041]|uniref:Helix-turn-helix domain-containing protein n=1 Tax=Streptomyces hazeniae TaxID=3075538 RepID=A0ABU2NJZ0_9ACTN|nr:hypothetical protein [Streptomyces sp. DSM 42041]MDT0377311.1 hypothetical protein [Streptomyces sp. DSM 42041]